jgi:hypothetical protein
MGVRASDVERERTVAQLHRAYAAGRLSVGELERRVARAYSAEWRAELRGLTRDLPFELPIDRTKMATGVDRFQRGLFRFHVWCFVVFNLVLVAMWSWGGGGDFFWPALSIVPGGALLLAHNRGSRAATRKLEQASGSRRRGALAA